MYEVVTDLDQSAVAIEHSLQQIVQDLKRELKIPLAVKLSPFFTAFGNVARVARRGRRERARAVQSVSPARHRHPASGSVAASGAVEQRRTAAAPAVARDPAWPDSRLLAVTGGVATPNDGIKAILAGADAVQMVSAILRHGPSYFASMRDELRGWMESRGFASLGDIRGRLSLAKTETPNAYERAQYIRTLSGWGSWLGYQAYVRAHEDDEPTPPS